MIRITEAGPRLSNESLLTLERELATTLPAPYREFLLDTNGGVPTPDGIDVVGLPGTPTDVQLFFAIDDPIEACDIRWALGVHGPRLGVDLLPVACDSGGNLFCLSLRGPNVGSVLYVDVLDRYRRYHVANDFREFLGRIQE